ncbi:MAG TPA: hypothetical protein VGT05_01980 [Patescibacteria group bacterium]|nr:hypothetical protein [Patescibacteria group bacterium]
MNKFPEVLLNGNAPYLGKTMQLLSAVGQPLEYYQTEQFQPGHVPWEMVTYPGRSAISIGRHPDAFTLVPHTAAFQAFLDTYSRIDEYYGANTQLHPVRVDFTVTNGQKIKPWEELLAEQGKEISKQLRRSSRLPLLIVTQTHSPDTDHFMDVLRSNNIVATALFPIKNQRRPSYNYRDGFSSERLGTDELPFTKKYHIPAPPGKIIMHPQEAQHAYEQIADETGQPTVYVKLDASGGGYFTLKARSGEDAQEVFNGWVTNGDRSALYVQMIPVEIQGLIPSETILGIYSFQYAGKENVTLGLGFTEQVMTGDLWQGNIYNTQLERIPAEKRNATLQVIKEFQRRVLQGIKQEQQSKSEEQEFTTGGVDFALVDMNILKDNVKDIAAYIPEDFLAFAMTVGSDIVPVAIEHNGNRVSDALWPALVAQRLGIGDKPFMTNYVSPVATTLDVAWDFMKKSHLQYEKERGYGIVPLVWVLDESIGIKTGAMISIASSRQELGVIQENAIENLRKFHIIEQAA